MEYPLEMVVLSVCVVINLECVLDVEPNVFPKLVKEKGDSVFDLGENFVFPFQACASRDFLMRLRAGVAANRKNVARKGMLPAWQ